eukprot:scaffold561123_cov24-Prasinocladus_malaysianus.AAC.1
MGFTSPCLTHLLFLGAAGGLSMTRHIFAGVCGHSDGRGGEGSKTSAGLGFSAGHPPVFRTVPYSVLGPSPGALARRLDTLRLRPPPTPMENMAGSKVDGGLSKDVSSVVHSSSSGMQRSLEMASGFRTGAKC